MSEPGVRASVAAIIGKRLGGVYTSKHTLLDVADAVLAHIGTALEHAERANREYREEVTQHMTQLTAATEILTTQAIGLCRLNDDVARLKAQLAEAEQRGRATRIELDRWIEMVGDYFHPHTCGQGITETCHACWARERLFIALKNPPVDPPGALSAPPPGA